MRLPTFHYMYILYMLSKSSKMTIENQVREEVFLVWIWNPNLEINFSLTKSSLYLILDDDKCSLSLTGNKTVKSVKIHWYPPRCYV